MAVLQRIRNHSILLLVIVGLAMVAFIVGDLITSSSSIMQSRRDKVVTVDGQKVTYEEYEAARQRRQDFVKAMQGQELDNQSTQQLNNQVYQEIVTKSLIEKACKKFGLVVTKDEINELVQGQNMSPVLSQMFGQQAPQVVSYFVNLITNDGFEQAAQQNPFFSEENWMEIENQVALNRLVEKYTGLVAAAVTPNKLEAKDNFNGDNTECTFAYVKQYASSVPDSVVSVSKNDVEKYYNSTKRNYKLNAERRNVSYINVALRPSDEDYAQAEADIKALRDEFATTDEVAELVNGNSSVSYMDAWVPVSGFDGDTKEFVQNNGVGAILEPHRENGDYYMMARIIDKTVAPDSIELAMVVVPTSTEADSIKAVLAAATNANTALASYDQQQKFVGWMEDPSLLQNFGDELRNKIRQSAVGTTFIHDMNDNAHFVCKVTKKTAPVALAKVAIYANEVYPSTRTRGEEYGKLNRFLTTYKDVRSMMDSARAEGFMMMPTTLYSTSYNVGGVQDARRAVQFAFQNKKGDVSDIIETGDNLLVVAITGDIEKGYLDINDTVFYKQISQFNVLPLKKVEKLTADFDAVADKTLAGYAAAFNGASIDTAKFVNFNLSNVVGLGSEPKIFEAALKANPGDVLTVAGRNVVVALQLLSKNDKGLTYDEKARLETVGRTRDYAQAANAALQVLQDNAKIEDNRINFY